MDTTASSQPGSTLAAEYTAMTTTRQQFLRRAHLCSKITIPALIPTDNDVTERNQTIDLPQPWQSVGAAGVNTMAAKFVMTLLPSSVPFFQFVMGVKEREEMLGLPEEEQGQFAAAIEARLQKMEQDVLEDIELSTLRSQSFATFKHLLVGGNYTLFIKPDEIKGFPLNRFVVRRDGSGNVTKLIVKEIVAQAALPEGWLEKATAGNVQHAKVVAEGKDLDIYTVVKRVSKKAWTSWQEVLGYEVPGTRGRFSDENNPWIVLRMIAVDGEDYGRSYVEELYGDLKTAEDLSKAIAQGAMVSAELKWMVNPSGMTDIEDLEESVVGDYIPGRADDVAALRAEKLADFRVAGDTLSSVISRLERGFLMTSSVQRQAERVTAYEISVMSQEIEDTLGGYYSLLGQEFQLPIIRLWINKMQREGKLRKFPKDSIRPKIITGVDALGRGQNLMRLNGLFQDLSNVATILAGPLGRRFDLNQLIMMMANGRGVNIEPALIPEQVIQQQDAKAQQQQQAADIASRAAGPAAGALAQAAAQPQATE